jgi:hypothetical protein
MQYAYAAEVLTMLALRSDGGSLATHMQLCISPSGTFFMYDSGGGSAEINTLHRE